MVLINNDQIVNDERRSFHLTSEKYFRVELMHIDENDVYNDYRLNNENLMLIILQGSMQVTVNNQKIILDKSIPQIIITENEIFSITGLCQSIVEFIWSPGLYG
ncbi:MAG TPA: hypothetical protein PK514_02165 [Spirochaetota bacterium]|nr:hypothetical protein [Spirochaetota bacterium]